MGAVSLDAGGALPGPLAVAIVLRYDCSVSSNNLPGADLVDAGLADLMRGALTVPALLVSVGAPRLRQLGYDVPPAIADAEHTLYALLARDDAASAHRRYNALVQRLVSFERAAACVR